MASENDYSESHNKLVKLISKIFMIVICFFMIIAYIVIVFKIREVSLFTLGLLSLAGCLLTINLCSIFGLCPIKCSLIAYKNDVKQCLYQPGVYISGVFIGVSISSLIAFISTSNYWKIPELPEIDLPTLPEMPVMEI